MSQFPYVLKTPSGEIIGEGTTASRATADALAARLGLVAQEAQQWELDAQRAARADAELQKAMAALSSDDT